MSRIGKKIIDLPNNVEITVNNNIITVKGPKGELSQELLPFVSVVKEENTLSVKIINESNKFQKAMWGTSRALIQNLITGVTTGFKKQLELNGVGFKMALQGTNLILNIGYSHAVEIAIPESMSLSIDKNELHGESIDKQQLGDFFTRIHNLKPADPYKHKGFKFPGRFYRKKVGKKAK